MTFNPDEPAGVLVKTTLVDFPGQVACSFFLAGCNLRCPYCYNTELATGNLPTDDSSVSLSQLYQHLEKRKNVLSGICISGGEPLLSPLLPSIIIKARSLGYLIKIDTNGTNPVLLKELIHSPRTRPDFIAMDLKTSPERYGELALYDCRSNFNDKIKQSIDLLKDYEKEFYEFRTVLVPQLITEKDILELSTLIPENSNWKFAQFKNENCLSSNFSSIKPYTDEEIQKLINLAKTKIPGAELR